MLMYLKKACDDILSGSKDTSEGYFLPYISWN